MSIFKRISLLFVSATCAAAAIAGFAACGKEETPTVQGGSSTTLVTNKAPDELSPENAIFAFLQKQSELKSYKITTEGKAVANIAGYVQDIHNTTYKNGEDYLNQAESSSVLVNMKHQSFSKNGKVVYRDSFDGGMKVATKEEYKKVYGFTADDITLGGYVINEKTLRYAKLEETKGDTFTYYFRLAGDRSVASSAATESATTAVALQAKTYGGLEGLPSFSDVDIHLTLKKDWTPVSYTSECSYDCKKILKMSIVQTLSCTYSEVNGTVTIPSVSAFNEQLGATPSQVAPIQAETEPFMQLASALGSALDENETLSLPFSIALDLSGEPITVGGELSLKLRRGELEGGDMANAFVLRADLDLSAIPLLSQYANTFTVRYVGEGTLLLLLNNRTDGKDNYLFTYALDLGETLSSGAGLDLSVANLQKLLEQLVNIEKTDAGYQLAVKPEYVALLSARYNEFVTELAGTLGETHGYIASLLGFTIDALSADFAGSEKTTGAVLSLKATPPENTTMGEKIDLSLDVGLLNSSRLFSGAFGGELQLRLNPSAVWTQNFFAIAQGKLHLDLTPAQLILQMLGALGSMIPDLPSWISADLNSLDVYYPGNGVLTLALSNAAGEPVFTTDIDLTQYFPAATALDGEAGGMQGLQGLALPQIIFEIKENGFSISLGENLVQALDAAYQSLVQMAVDYVTAAAGDMGFLAGSMISGFLNAEITGAGIFIGRTEEGKFTFNLNVDGIPEINGDSEVVSLLSITLTHDGELDAEEKKTLLAVGETVKELREMNAKAADYDAQVQKLIEEMDVSEAGYEQYVAKVTALQKKIASEKDGVKSLMATKSYLAETTADEEKTTVLLLTAELYHARAEEFKTKFAEIKQSGSSDVEIDGKWDELNALYEKSATVSDITVPAVNGNKVLINAIGEDLIKEYLAKRDEYETAMANALKAKIETAAETFAAAEGRDDWTDALTEIVTDFKPVYDKLPADKQANVTGYSKYVKDIYIRNIDGVMAEYKAVQTELEELDENEDVTIDELLAAMKKLSLAYAWGYGYDYWETNTIEKVQPWGTTWITSLKPADLSEEEQAKISDLNTLNRSLMKGTTATEVLGKYTDLIITEVRALYEQIKDCRTVTEGEDDRWNFETLDDQEAVLEKIHGLRFLICKVLPSSINDEFEKDPELNQFARIDLTKYEEALVEHLKATPGD